MRPLFIFILIGRKLETRFNFDLCCVPARPLFRLDNLQDLEFRGKAVEMALNNSLKGTGGSKGISCLCNSAVYKYTEHDKTARTIPVFQYVKLVQKHPLLCTIEIVFTTTTSHATMIYARMYLELMAILCW